MANLENVGRRSTEGSANPGLKLKTERLWLYLEPLLPILFIAALLVLWEWSALSGRISALFFPPPTAILRTLVELLVNGALPIATTATLARLTLGCIIGCIPGLILGLAMGWSNRLRIMIDPIVAALHPLPKIAILPLLLIIFGIGETSKVAAIAISAFFPMLINSMAGVRQINPVYFEVTRNYRASQWKIFSRVVLPGSLPLVLTGLRLAISVAMVITITVELVAAKAGLGVMIWFAWQTLRIEDLYAVLVITGLLGVAINFILQHLSTRLCPWYSDQQSKF